MRLRYVGSAPTTFITGSVGAVGPGDEFTVPDELVPAFLARTDVEEVVEEPAETQVKKRSRSKEPGQSVSADSGDPEKMSEENGDVPNDH